MTIFSRYGAKLISVSEEESVIILKALDRSQRAMPDPTETFASRAVRADRERKLALKMRNALGDVKEPGRPTFRYPWLRRTSGAFSA